MTDIEIANLALSWCGSKPITQFEDSTPEARVAKANYTPAKLHVLADREWTFAKDRLLLNKDPVAPVFGYTYKFIIPTTVVRVVRVFNDANSDDQLDDWVREGWRVLTNEDSPIYAEVLTQVTEASFSPGMVQALAHYLTSVMAIPLTENRNLALDHAKQYEAMVRTAAAMDGSQGRTQRMKPPRLPGRVR